MNRLNQTNVVVMEGFNWRHGLLLVIVFGAFLWLCTLGPISQNLTYHDFADQVYLGDVPNFFNVLSNIPFFIIGFLGLYQTLSIYQWRVMNGWTLFFVGMTLVSIASFYYHWSPSNDLLVWERLPMIFGLLGFYVALIGECVSSKLSRLMLLPTLFIGILSVTYWYWADDLRLYFWVQLVPMLTIPVMLLFFPKIYSHYWLLFMALVFFLLAKIAELNDLNIYLATGEVISGHTVKHLLAAIGCYFILWMLRNRTVIPISIRK